MITLRFLQRNLFPLDLSSLTGRSKFRTYITSRVQFNLYTIGEISNTVKRRRCPLEKTKGKKEGRGVWEGKILPLTFTIFFSFVRATDS